MKRHFNPIFLIAAFTLFGTGKLLAEPTSKKTSQNDVRSSKSSSTDWPRWRGPNADGVAEGRSLPTRWSQTESIRWSVKLPGWGTSSPVVYQNRVFVTSETIEDEKKS